MSNIERGHHGYFLSTVNVAAALNRAHILVEIARRLHERLLLRGRAVDLILFVENLNLYGGRLLAHVCVRPRSSL